MPTYQFVIIHGATPIMLHYSVGAHKAMFNSVCAFVEPYLLYLSKVHILSHIYVTNAVFALQQFKLFCEPPFENVLCFINGLCRCFSCLGLTT